MAATTITPSQAHSLAAAIDTAIKALGKPPTPPSTAFRSRVENAIQHCLDAVLTPTTNIAASKNMVRAALKDKYKAMPALGAPALATGACYYQTGTPAAVTCIDTNVNDCAAKGGVFFEGDTCATMTDVRTALANKGIAPF